MAYMAARALIIATLAFAVEAKRIASRRVFAASELSFGHQVAQPEYEHQDNAPEYEHVRPHPKLSGTAETPEQGYVGKDVIHTNFETATGDWTSESGPTKKPVTYTYVPPPPAPTRAPYV